MSRLVYTSLLDRWAVLLFVACNFASQGQAQFVAFNDQAPGSGTSSNATTWNIRTNQGFVLPLKDINSGNPVSVSLEIRTNKMNVTGSRVYFPIPSTAGTPLPGTPAYNVFNGFVDFGGSGDSSVELQGATAAVTNIFSGLDPSKTYHLQASAVRNGSADYSNRWALVSLLGAASFQSAHTANTVTTAQDPNLGPHQVALNTGLNAAGDMADFRSIIPAGSTIMLVSMHYSNATVVAPNGFRCNGTKGYAITGFRLEEVGGDPNALSISSPADLSIFVAGQPIVINVTAGPGISRVHFYDGATLLGNDSTAPFSIVLSNAALGTHTLRAVGATTSGSITSAPVAIQVNANRPPSVRITNLVEAQSFLVGTSTIVNADATDPDDGLARVDFYIDGSFFYGEVAPPYFVEFNNMPAGVHTLTVRAVDYGGLSVTSPPVHITVTNVPGVSVLIPNRSVWKYLDTGQDQGTAWRTVAFNDMAWKSGPAELGFGDSVKDSSNGTPKPEQTLIAGGPATARFRTTYFRRNFYLSNPVSMTNLLLHLLRDDGGVVYLNGQEVFRSNMPTTNDVPWSMVAFTDWASSALGDDGTVYVSTNFTNPHFLLSGLNTIAVEVHQNSGTSSDLSFDLMLWAEPLTGGFLTSSPHPSDPSLMTIHWTGSGTLQQSTELNSPNSWQDVTPQPAGNSYTISRTSGPQKFFRLR